MSDPQTGPTTPSGDDPTESEPPVQDSPNEAAPDEDRNP